MLSIKGIGHGGQSGARLNMILQELQSVKTEVLVGAAAAAAIPVVGAEMTDTIISVVMYAAGVPSLVALSDASFVDRRAKGTLTLAGVVAADTAVVNGKTYAARAHTPNPSNSGDLKPAEFAVGGTDTITAANLAARINANDKDVIATSAGAVVTITARALGVSGNSIALGNTPHFTRSAATLAGGTATTALVLATTNSTGNRLVVQWAKTPAVAI